MSICVCRHTHIHRDMINSSKPFPFTDKNLYYYSNFWIIIYSSKSFINLLCKLHIDLVLSMKSEHCKIFMCQAPKIQIYNDSYKILEFYKLQKLVKIFILLVYA